MLPLSSNIVTQPASSSTPPVQIQHAQPIPSTSRDADLADALANARNVSLRLPSFPVQATQAAAATQADPTAQPAPSPRSAASSPAASPPSRTRTSSPSTSHQTSGQAPADPPDSHFTTNIVDNRLVFTLVTRQSDEERERNNNRNANAALRLAAQSLNRFIANNRAVNDPSHSEVLRQVGEIERFALDDMPLRRHPHYLRRIIERMRLVQKSVKGPRLADKFEQLINDIRAQQSSAPPPAPQFVHRDIRRVPLPEPGPSRTHDDWRRAPSDALGQPAVSARKQEKQMADKNLRAHRSQRNAESAGRKATKDRETFMAEALARASFFSQPTSRPTPRGLSSSGADLCRQAIPASKKRVPGSLAQLPDYSPESGYHSAHSSHLSLSRRSSTANIASGVSGASSRDSGISVPPANGPAGATYKALGATLGGHSSKNRDDKALLKIAIHNSLTQTANWVDAHAGVSTHTVPPPATTQELPIRLILRQPVTPRPEPDLRFATAASRLTYFEPVTSRSERTSHNAPSDIRSREHWDADRAPAEMVRPTRTSSTSSSNASNNSQAALSQWIAKTTQALEQQYRLLLVAPASGVASTSASTAASTSVTAPVARGPWLIQDGGTAAISGAQHYGELWLSSQRGAQRPVPSLIEAPVVPQDAKRDNTSGTQRAPPETGSAPSGTSDSTPDAVSQLPTGSVRMPSERSRPSHPLGGEWNAIRGVALANPAYFYEAPDGAIRSSPIVLGEHPHLAITVMREQGLRHIVTHHGREFRRMFEASPGVAIRPGNLDERITEFTLRALSVGEVVGRQGGTDNGRPVYRLRREHHAALTEDIYIAITVGTNGYVVGANPIRSSHELAKVLARGNL